ncbi:MAG: DMT family transporter [Methylobacterium sp.]|uniref:DMT family transporter n=1 Tax=Methylobacterium sp. TaxID=409 RepID=UPI0025865439|nr:DMT family transporter [Methylobacterium sp.]MBY0299105.1 DMT family transporter [Methylobacterium sp.]
MWFLYALTLLAGIANAVQPGPNATLAKTLGQPFAAGLVVVTVSGTTLLTLGLLSGRLHLPSLEEAARAPWWAWCGGILGALLVLSQLFVARQIGAAPFLGLLVTAGVITSIVLDHFGWVGFKEHPAGLGRIAGGVLMVLGVSLVALF